MRLIKSIAILGVLGGFAGISMAHAEDGNWVSVERKPFDKKEEKLSGNTKGFFISEVWEINFPTVQLVKENSQDGESYQYDSKTLKQEKGVKFLIRFTDPNSNSENADDSFQLNVRSSELSQNLLDIIRTPVGGLGDPWGTAYRKRLSSIKEFVKLNVKQIQEPVQEIDLIKTPICNSEDPDACGYPAVYKTVIKTRNIVSLNISN